MLQIAICDDEVEELKRISHLAAVYAETHPELNIACSQFHSPCDLLEVLEKNRHFNIYLLDILMPELDGLSVGKAIRTKDSSATIIYLSFSSDYAVESYRVRAQDYLLKPFTQMDLFATLDEAIKIIDAEDARRLPMRTQEGVQAIPFYQIAYVESYEHHFFCGLTDGQVIESKTQRVSFSRFIKPLLRDGRFIQTSVSYAVNMQHIRTITGEGCRMADGTTVPITRAYSDSRNAYLDYLLERR